MPRRKNPNQPIGIAGRKPKDPMTRVGLPVRALVTWKVIEALQESMGIHDLPASGLIISGTDTRVSSNILRLAIYRLLEQDGLMTPELQEDDSWKELREKGLV